MIKAADIGIGLFGKEGLRAVDTSDFAVTQFQHLWPLIFKHGRWNYIRSANLFNFYVYKAFAYTLIQVVYAGYNGWSSQTVFPDWFLTLFNMIFSAYPIFAYAWQEIDVFPIEMYRKFIPALYHVG